MEDDFQDEDCGVAAKRIKLSVDDEFPLHTLRGLLDLSDDVLLIIFAFLSPTDLINLSQSCVRLWNVTRDRTLWTHVDCRENFLDADVFEDSYLDYLLPCTKFLAVDFRTKTRRRKGRRLRPVNAQGSLTFSLLKNITQVCVNLHTLILQDVSFDAQQIPVRFFPSTLSHLSLKNSDVRNLPVRVSYFNEIHLVMPSLQDLILSHSLWLESHSLMAISKCLKLTELRLQGCFALGDCIAYFSIATRFGFKALETLDLRGTQVGDPEVCCLNLVPTLRHLYLESISQYARRRDAEYYMNRVRQFPDITIVPNPDARPVQNPVILLQRIDGEMVARNVTSEYHNFGHPAGDASPSAARSSPTPSHGDERMRQEPGTSGTSGPRIPPRPHSGCVRALVEKWDTAFRTNRERPSTSHDTRSMSPRYTHFLPRFQVPGSHYSHFDNSSSRGPVVVVPMPQRRTTADARDTAGESSSNNNSSNGPSLGNLLENAPRATYRYSALENALRLRGVLTLINESSCSSYSRNRPNDSGSSVSNTSDNATYHDGRMRRPSSSAWDRRVPFYDDADPRALSASLEARFYQALATSKSDESGGEESVSRSRRLQSSQKPTTVTEGSQTHTMAPVTSVREQVSAADADKRDEEDGKMSKCSANERESNLLGEDADGTASVSDQFQTNSKDGCAKFESSNDSREPKSEEDPQSTFHTNGLGNGTSKSSLRKVNVEEGRVVVRINNVKCADDDGPTETHKRPEDNNHDEVSRHVSDQSDGDPCLPVQDELNSAVISSDTNDSDCGREGGDEDEGRNASSTNCKRFKKPLVRNPNSVGSSKTQSAYESDDDSDVGADVLNYREYMSKYVIDSNSSLRVKALKNLKKRLIQARKGGEGIKNCLPNFFGTHTKQSKILDENKVSNVSADNSPGCSYVTEEQTALRVNAPVTLDCCTSLPSCSKYDPQQDKVPNGLSSEPNFGAGPSCSRSDTKKRKLPVTLRELRNRFTTGRKRPSPVMPNSNDNDEGNYSSEGDGNSDTSPNGPDTPRRVRTVRITDESESDSPDIISNSDEEQDLHFCTIGRARFPGLTMPFFHRVPQVTNSCVNAICSGKSYVRPQLGYNIMTLRANPKEPVHECRLETLVLRHFSKITDQSLYVLSKLMSLKFLDVTGTSVTACGVKNFRLMRPDVKVTSDHDNPIEP